MDDLPLLELFTQLQRAGLPIGIEDYQAALKALQAGYGLPDRASLARLCRSLWVRSPDEHQLFNYYFERLIGADLETIGLILRQKETTITESEPVEFALNRRNITISLAVSMIAGLISNSKRVIDLFMTLQSLLVKNTSQQNYWFLGVAVLLLLISMGIWLFRESLVKNQKDLKPTKAISRFGLSDEVQMARVVLQTKGEANRVQELAMLTDFMPITRRQMKQSWRYLRQVVRGGLTTELDVNATIKQIARHSLFA